MRSAFNLVLLLALLLSPLGCQRERPEANADEPAPLAIAFSGNVRGYVEPCGCAVNELGGLARRTSLLEKLRQSRPDLLYLDYGNLLFDSGALDADKVPLEMAKARVLVEGTSQMGLAAFTPGEADLAAGLGALQELLGRARFVAVSANLARRESGEPLFERWTLVRAGPHRIGVTGVTEDFLARRPDLQSDLAVLDPVASLAEVLEQMRGKADRVVVLARLDAARRLEVAALPGVDFVLGSTEEPRTSGMSAVGKALLGAVSDRGQRVGWIETRLAAGRTGFQQAGSEGGPDGAGNPYTAQIHEVRLDLPEEPTTFLLVDEWRRQRELFGAAGP